MIRLLLAVILAALPAAAREVAITFDDLPDDSDPRLVARLRTAKIPATGFVNEQGIDDPSSLAVWHGFELGNHTYAHTDLHTAGIDEFTCDTARGDAMTRALLGRAPIWFRHPYLNTGSTIEQRDAVDAFLAQRGYVVAPVTIDDSDWIFATAYDLAPWWRRRALRRAYIDYMRQRFDWAEHESRLVFGREIPQVLLLHACALNADAIDDLLRMIRTRGYAFIPLADAVADSAYASPDTWVGGGVGWIERWGVTAGMDEIVFENDPAVPEWVQRIAKQRDE